MQVGTDGAHRTKSRRFGRKADHGTLRSVKRRRLYSSARWRASCTACVSSILLLVAGASAVADLGSWRERLRGAMLGSRGPGFLLLVFDSWLRPGCQRPKGHPYRPVPSFRRPAVCAACWWRPALYPQRAASGWVKPGALGPAGEDGEGAPDSAGSKLEVHRGYADRRPCHRPLRTRQCPTWPGPPGLAPGMGHWRRRGPGPAACSRTALDFLLPVARHRQH